MLCSSASAGWPARCRRTAAERRHRTEDSGSVVVVGLAAALQVREGRRLAVIQRPSHILPPAAPPGQIDGRLGGVGNEAAVLLDRAYAQVAPRGAAGQSRCIGNGFPIQCEPGAGIALLDAEAVRQGRANAGHRSLWSGPGTCVRGAAGIAGREAWWRGNVPAAAAGRQA